MGAPTFQAYNWSYGEMDSLKHNLDERLSTPERDLT